MVGAAARIKHYAITDLSADYPWQHTEALAQRRERWNSDLRRWAAQGIGFVQLREKALDAAEVFALATAGTHLLNQIAATGGVRPQLLVNGRADIAASAHADGVHLTARPGELTPGQVREVFRAAGLHRCTVSVSCHALHEVAAAREQGADLILFGPVFEKRIGERLVAPGSGLDALGTVCVLAGEVPVLALGGVDKATEETCMSMGAAGVAGIRIFSGR